MSKVAAKEKSLRMMYEGKTNDEIVVATGLKMDVVTRQRGFFNSPLGKAWQIHEKERREPARQPVDDNMSEQGLPSLENVEGPGELVGPSQRGPKQPTVVEHSSPGLRFPGNGNGSQVIQEGIEKQLLVAGEPLLRKIVMNPKVYFWYDYAKAKMGFKGDVGDFVFDCVEDFFASRGYAVIVEKREVTEVR